MKSSALYAKVLGGFLAGICAGAGGVAGYLFSQKPRDHYAEGRVLMQKSKFDDAAEAFRRALATNPENPVAKVALGSALQSAGRPQDAYDEYKAADAAASAMMIEFYGNLGALHQQKKDAAGAADAYRKLAVFKPQSMDAHYNLGMTAAAHGQGGDAIQHFEQALQVNPQHAAAAFQAGRVAEQKGDRQQAIEYYQRALEIDSGLKAAKDRLAALSASGSGSVQVKKKVPSKPSRGIATQQSSKKPAAKAKRNR